MGWLDIINAAANLGRGAAGQYDYWRPGGARDAADEATESARNATQAAFDHADWTRGELRGQANDWRSRMLGGYSSQGTLADVGRALGEGVPVEEAMARFGPQWDPGVIQNTANAQRANVDAWWSDYQNRGGARGQAEGILNDPRYNQGMTAAFNQAAMIPQYQAEYARARDASYGNLDFIQGRQDSLGQRYGDARQEARDTMNIEGMEQNRLDLREQFVHQTGGRQVLGAVQGDVMARDQALADLESQRGTMSPMQYAQARKAVTDQYNSAIVTKTGAEYDRVNQQWLGAEVELGGQIAAQRNNLVSRLNELVIGEGAEAIGLAGAASNEIGNIVSNLNGETSFINNATRDALEASQFAIGMLWQAVGADESARKFATVDAPNQILDTAAARTMQVEAQYIDAMFRAQQQSDLFSQLGLNMQYNFSPTIADLTDYMTPLVEGTQNIAAMQFQREQMDMARNAQSQQQTLGWINAGANMFNFGYRPPANTGGWYGGI